MEKVLYKDLSHTILPGGACGCPDMACNSSEDKVVETKGTKPLPDNQAKLVSAVKWEPRMTIQTLQQN